MERRGDMGDYKELYIGNYGYPPNSNPIELPSDVCDWLDRSLGLKIKMGAHQSWASSKLESIAEILEDKGENQLAEELWTIRQTFENDAEEDMKNNTQAYQKNRKDQNPPTPPTKW